MIDLTPSQETPGTYQAEWTAEKPGTYLAEVVSGVGRQHPQELGRDVVIFQREDGVAENFHTEQNREFLEQLAAQTGGRYWKPGDLKNLPRDISYSDAGISVRSTKELWNMPIVFALSGGTAGRGVAAAAQVGCGMKRALRLAVGASFASHCRRVRPLTM